VWIGTDQSTKLQKLDHIKPPLTLLNLRNERLRALQPRRHVLLGKPCLLPRPDQQIQQTPMRRRMDGFQSWDCRSSLPAVQGNLKRDYPKKGLS
jgi:hypothetical protein